MPVDAKPALQRIAAVCSFEDLGAGTLSYRSSQRHERCEYPGEIRIGPPSSSGLGRRPFTAVARVRIPLGVHATTTAVGVAHSKALWRSWLARRPVTAEVAGSSPVRVAIAARHFVQECSVPSGQVAQLVRASA